MTEWGIDTLFNPGKRHMDEEKRRLQSTREEVGDSSGGKRIDLEAGVVKIAISKKAPAADQENGAEAEADSDAGNEIDTDKADLGVDSGTPTTESPALVRGRARRGLTSTAEPGEA